MEEKVYWCEAEQVLVTVPNTRPTNGFVEAHEFEGNRIWITKWADLDLMNAMEFIARYASER